jgi:hypothetical protein
MTAPTLTEMFAGAGGGSVEVDGRVVTPLTRMVVADGTRVIVTRLTASRRRDQALVIAVDRGLLEIDGFEAPAVSLWTSTSPRQLELVVRGNDAGALDIWNAWRGPTFEGAWLGNAGIVEQPVEGGITLQCSDGVGEPDFTDLVVRIELITP